MSIPIVAAIWAGALLGVSFLATPIKFRARTLPYHAALEVGRVTYFYFTRIEWALLAILVALTAAGPPPGAIDVALLAAVAALIVLQGAWLIRHMDRRVTAALKSRTRPPPSRTHQLYIATEIAKVAALVTIATA